MTFVLYLVEMIKFAIIYRMGFGLPFKKNIISYITLIVSWVGISVYMILFEEVSQPIFAYLFVVSLTSIICFQYSKKKMFWISLWSAVLIGLLDGITQTTLNVTFFICGIEDILYKDFWLEICALILIYLVFFFVHRHNKYPLSDIPVKYFIILFLILIFNMFFIALVYEIVMNKFFEYLWVFYGVSCSVFLQVLFILLLAASNVWQKEKDKLNQQFLKQQEEHYLYLEKREEETRKFRHDMKNHFHIIEQLCKDKNTEEIENYIETIFGKLGVGEERVTTNNRIVDAIINQFVSLGKDRKIEFLVKGHLPVSCNIPPFDLCCVFSNILQNAMEAVELCDNKRIQLNLRYDNDYIYIQEENDYAGDLQMAHGKLLSKKANKEFHGYGLKNIEDSVKKYQGNMEYRVENGHFTVMLSMALLTD